MHLAFHTWTQLRWARNRQCQRIALWLFSHLIAGLFPLWGSAILLVLMSQRTSIDDYVSHGEFCLYAAALAGSTLFVILSEARVLIRGRNWLVLGSVAVLVLAVLIFAGAFILNCTDGSDLPLKLNIRFLAIMSIVLYLVSLLLATLTHYFESLGSRYDPSEVQAQSQDALAQDFRSLEE